MPQLLAAALLTLAPGTLVSQTRLAPDSEVQALISARAALVPDAGMVIGLLDASGRRTFSAGTLNGQETPAPDGATLFEIGSVSKTFTATALAVMSLEGLVRLDEPVAKLLPDSVRVPARHDTLITLLDLATQSSGLPRLPDNMPMADPDNPYADYSEAGLYRFLNSYALPRAPGTQYEYSNLGMGLLGFALARRANTSYERLIVDRISLPLGLKDTRITLTPGEARRLAPGHDIAGDSVANWDLPVLAGAGALRSTVNDLLAYVAAYLAPDSTVLGRAMDMAVQPLRPTTVPETVIALAWHIRESGRQRIVWHNGGTGGYHTFVGFDRARGTGVVILANSTLNTDDIGMHLLNPAIPIEPPPVPPHRTAVSLTPGELAPYLGSYRLAPGAVLSVTRREGDLFVQLTGQPRFHLYAEGADRFYLGVVDAELEFERDAAGKVTGVVLHQNGRDVKGLRTED